jgi:hypothetical protein
MLASVSHPIRFPEYAHARGRNGDFAPKSIEVQVDRTEDGTPIVRICVYSRRHGDGPPVVVTVAVREWRELSMLVAQEVARALSERQEPGPEARG